MFCCSWTLMLSALHMMYGASNGAMLWEPPVIAMKDQSTYHIRAEYCPFTAFDDNGRLVINMTTRCFCYKSYCNVPGATFIINSGTTVNIILSNHMTGASSNVSLMNSYKDLDVTNLHTHGLHIDPNVDDMFVHLDPMDPDATHPQRANAHHYSYSILADHQSGTHWYHAHWHGCVALAISGGQFGALIVENKARDQAIAGLMEMDSNLLFLHSQWILNETQCDCDDLAVEYQYCMRGFFMLFTHCAMYCQQPKYQRDKSGIQYDMRSHAMYNNKRIYFVNGQYQPTIPDIPINEWRRLRVINGDMQQYYQMEFTVNANGEKVCNHTCNVRLMALDGTYLKDIDRNLCNYPYDGYLLIPPGGRADVAIQCNVTQAIHVKASERNLYDFLANYTRADDGVILFKLRILNWNSADVSTLNMHPYVYPQRAPDPAYYLQSLIDGESEQTKRYPVYKTCDCTSYNRSLKTMEMDMTRHMDMQGMNMANNERKILPFCSKYVDKNDPSKMDECNECGFYFLGMPWTNINFKKFSMDEPLLRVFPNAIYEFKNSAKGPHPLHNHVNPLQLMENVGASGFVGRRGDWRDTIGFAGTFTFRIITLDFVGKNIMHCHTLTHEDTGMMAYYEIMNVTQGSMDGNCADKYAADSTGIMGQEQGRGHENDEMLMAALCGSVVALFVLIYICGCAYRSFGRKEYETISSGLKAIRRKKISFRNINVEMDNEQKNIMHPAASYTFQRE